MGLLTINGWKAFFLISDFGLNAWFSMPKCITSCLPKN